jgi:hypothetical protein
MFLFDDTGKQHDELTLTVLVGEPCYSLWQNTGGERLGTKAWRGWPSEPKPQQARVTAGGPALGLAQGVSGAQATWTPARHCDEFATAKSPSFKSLPIVVVRTFPQDPSHPGVLCRSDS